MVTVSEGIVCRKKYGMDIVDSEIQKQYGNYISNTIANLEAAKNNSSTSK